MTLLVHFEAPPPTTPTIIELNKEKISHVAAKSVISMQLLTITTSFYEENKILWHCTIRFKILCFAPCRHFTHHLYRL